MQWLRLLNELWLRSNQMFQREKVVNLEILKVELNSREIAVVKLVSRPYLRVMHYFFMEICWIPRLQCFFWCCYCGLFYKMELALLVRSTPKICCIGIFLTLQIRVVLYLGRYPIVASDRVEGTHSQHIFKHLNSTFCLAICLGWIIKELIW